MKSKKTKQNSKENFTKTREKPSHTITVKTFLLKLNYSNNFYTSQKNIILIKQQQNTLLKHLLAKRTSMKAIVTDQLTPEQL